MGELYRRIYYLLHRRRFDAEMKSDMEFHREMAARQGRNNFGNMLHMRELAHEAWGWTWLEHLGQDIRWAGRGIKRAPGSAVAMVLLLALGMGGVMALFGPLYSLVLRPLPFPHPDRLVKAGGSILRFDIYAKNTYFKNRRKYDPIFSDFMAYSAGEETVSGDGPTEDIEVATVTQEFFSTLGVGARLGAGLPVDASVSYKVDYYHDLKDAYNVVVSDELWRTRLRSEHDLRKCWITLGGNRYSVIGVMPPSFDFPSGAQVWKAGQVSYGSVIQVGRLRPGLSMTQAQVGLKTVDSQDLPAGAVNLVTLDSLHDAILGDRRPSLWILSAVSALFLALACAGVANLLLARGVRRRPEMVVRAVLGAERGRLIRQLLCETLLLAAAGGLLGIGISVLAHYGLGMLFPALMKDTAPVSPAAIALVVVLTVVVSILCGVAPAFHATGVDLNSALKAGNTVASTSALRRGRFSAHELFAGGQLMLAMILLIATGLLLHSLNARINFPMGFSPKDIALVKVRFPYPLNLRAVIKNYWTQHPCCVRTPAADKEMEKSTGPANEAEIAIKKQFYLDATRRLAEVPGVVSVAAMNTPPLTKDADFCCMGLGEFDRPEPGERHPRGVGFGYYREVSVGALSMLGIRLVAGRDFVPSDIPTIDAFKVWLYHENDNTPRPTEPVIVNEKFAHTAWPNQNPLGKTFRYYFPQKVVGVVADIHETRDNPLIYPTVYTPLTVETTLGRETTFLVKLRPGTKLDGILKVLPPTDADAIPPTVVPMQQAPMGNLSIALALLSCFSILGEIVAGLGVYATATLMAASRTREMGIRLAIGASAQQVGRMVLWRSIRLALLALPTGAFGAWLLGLSLKHWLFEVGVTDPISYVSSAAILLVIALAAGLWPALRAATTDPSTALRYDG